MLSDFVSQSNNKDFIAGNAKLLRKINTETILRVIRERQPISRSQIAELTHLNKGTVSNITSQLLKDDLILETSADERSIGRNPLNLSLKLGKHFVGSIDLDSPVTRIGVVDIDGSVKGMSSIHLEPGTAEESVTMCVQELKKICTRLGIERLEGLGVSVSGLVNSREQIVDFASNLRWENFNIGETIRRLLPDNKNLSVGNGANVSALAESWFGTHEVDLTNFIFLSVHPGIGSGIIIGNKLVEGEYQASGEIGHMVIYPGGEPCLCGSNGCLEAYASDRATVRRYIAEKYGNVAPPTDISLENIIDLARQGDGTAVEVLKQTGYYLGLGISNAIKVIDPRVIIVGGLITRSWDLIHPEIMKVIRQQAYFGRRESVEILPTSLTVPPRLLGAATLAIERMFDDYSLSD
jgi:predicted NBD/HSP70 family sugar kinase